MLNVEINMAEINEDNLKQLVEYGGIFYQVPGNSKQEIMSNIINRLENSTREKKEKMLEAVIEREALVSTGMENGIAIPHPRTPMLDDDEKPFVTIAFPEQPAEWGTPDNKKIHTIFLIISKTPKQHLGALSKINYICRQESFLTHLLAKADKEKLLTAIEECETAWGKI